MSFAVQNAGNGNQMMNYMYMDMADDGQLNFSANMNSLFSTTQTNNNYDYLNLFANILGTGISNANSNKKSSKNDEMDYEDAAKVLYKNMKKLDKAAGDTKTPNEFSLDDIKAVAKSSTASDKLKEAAKMLKADSGQLFNAADEDNNGRLSKDELRAVYDEDFVIPDKSTNNTTGTDTDTSIDMDEKEAAEILAKKINLLYRAAGDTTETIKQFNMDDLKAIVKSKTASKELKEAAKLLLEDDGLVFRSFDAPGRQADGFINLEELKEVYGEETPAVKTPAPIVVTVNKPTGKATQAEWDKYLASESFNRLTANEKATIITEYAQYY